MATVRVTQPEPTPPPKTYDILGLTEDEMELIVNLVGLTGGNLGCKLYNTLPHGLFRFDYFPGPTHGIIPTNGK